MSEIRTVNSLAEYITEVGKIRSELERCAKLEPHQELWFRGEPSDYGDTKLSPKLLRPVDVSAPVDVGNLLDIDSDLFDEFCRRGVEMQYVSSDGGEEDWKWYYLMQHYGAPTHLLDWLKCASTANAFPALERNCATRG